MVSLKSVNHTGKEKVHFQRISGNNIYFSGQAQDSINRIAISMPKKLKNFVSEYEAVNGRIITYASRPQHA